MTVQTVEAQRQSQQENPDCYRQGIGRTISDGWQWHRLWEFVVRFQLKRLAYVIDVYGVSARLQAHHIVERERLFVGHNHRRARLTCGACGGDCYRESV